LILKTHAWYVSDYTFTKKLLC